MKIEWGGSGKKASSSHHTTNLKTKLSLLHSCGLNILCHLTSNKLSFCSDFCNENNGIFVLGWVFFFLQTNFDFLTNHFWRNFLYHSKSTVVLSLNLKKIFHLWWFFAKLWGFKDSILANLGQLMRDMFRAINA